MKLKDRKRIRKWLIKHPQTFHRVLCYSCRGKGSRYGEFCNTCKGTGRAHPAKDFYAIHLSFYQSCTILFFFAAIIVGIFFVTKFI